MVAGFVVGVGPTGRGVAGVLAAAWLVLHLADLTVSEYLTSLPGGVFVEVNPPMAWVLDRAGWVGVWVVTVPVLVVVAALIAGRARSVAWIGWAGAAYGVPLEAVVVAGNLSLVVAGW